MRSIALALWLFLAFEGLAMAAGQAPGGPGATGFWSRPDKEGFLATRSQKVWATISEGILSEVYYPSVDTAQTKDTQLLFVIGGQTVIEERRDFTYQVQRYPQTLAYHVTSVNQNFQIKIEKDIVLDPQRPAVVMNYRVTFGQPLSAKIYVLHNPACDNTHGGDGMYVAGQRGENGQLMAMQTDRRGDEPAVFQNRAIQILELSRPADEATVGFEGVNDPWTQLKSAHRLAAEYTSALNGNVAGALGFDVTNQRQIQFQISLTFSLENQTNPAALKRLGMASLKASGSQLLGEQKSEWGQYLGSLNSLGQKFEGQVLVLKGLEDKTYKGAIIAGPSLPSLPDRLEAEEVFYEGGRKRLGDVNGGYHRVWSRDAFQMAMGLLAAGDTETPLNVLRYYAHTQRNDGWWLQNTWVNGQESWTGYQSDQTGFPIILASRLVEMGIANYGEFRTMVVNAADFLVRKGPWTDMERWEENKGLSPNSIAVACQGLLEAAFLEKNLDPQRSQFYQSTCQSWRDSLVRWTYAEHGPLGQGYFIRLEQADDPSHTTPIQLKNQPVGGDVFPENEIMDGGFLQWILSGLVPPTDPHFSSSIAVYDRVARGEGHGGQVGFLRYNHDGYGVGHTGRSWPLLSGERAIAAIERHEDPSYFIRTLMNAITPSGMVCEQMGISACPLGWAHAEVLLVARSAAEGKSFYIPRRARNYAKLPWSK